MPTRPGHQCNVVGCPAIVPAGESYCTLHKREERRPRDKAIGIARRGTYHDWYSQDDWRRVRHSYLLRFPYCVYCIKAGHTVKAEVVDHIVPHKGDREAFFDEANFQSLCYRCHNSKTAKEFYK